MRCLKRNKRQIWYCLYSGATELYDENDNPTGEYGIQYSEPVSMLANISPATGLSNTEQFGNLDNYDKVIVTDDLNCPIDEHSVLFVDKEPEHDLYDAPLYDYIVKRVARSLNSVSIAIAKVVVS